MAGPCLDPITIEYAGTGQVAEGGLVNLRHHRMFVDTIVRCRSCTNCLKYRAWDWRTRAQSEVEGSQRTWFGTLTLSPESHFRMQALACQRWKGFISASEDKQFSARHVAISSEITRWLKRVRKASGASLRYIIVAERHKSGLPHYHALVHETPGSRPVTYRHLADKWAFGFCKWNLVHDPKAANYVCKYLSKDASARVRASIGYGKLDITLSSIGQDETTAFRATTTPQLFSDNMVTDHAGF